MSRWLNLIIFTSLFLALLGCQVLPAESVILPISSPQSITSNNRSDIPPNNIPSTPITPTSIPTSTFASEIEPSATPSRKVTLMAVGDIMLGRTIGDLIESEGYQAPFFYTAETLNQADITVGNLENPISERGEPENKPYAFRAPLAAGQSLAFAGFDVVSLANNHSLDYGVEALQDTIDILAVNQVLSVGAGMNDKEAYAPVFLEVNGLRLAFLAFAEIPAAVYDYTSWEADTDKPGIAWAHPDRVQAGVQAAKVQADIVIVLVHNGYEFFETVTQHQQAFAHLAIESGADLVVGSHPHVLQRIEQYQDGLIAYSMGNFVFDNFLFPPNLSGILKVELSENGFEAYELIDVVVQLNGVPQVMPWRQYVE